MRTYLKRRGIHKPVNFRWRLLRYLLGVASLGLAIAVMLASGIGLGPWDVFHQGLSKTLGLSFGQVLVGVGFFILAVAWVTTRERPGPGTFVNMMLVGPSVDLYQRSGLVPNPETWWLGAAQFVVGTALAGLGAGLYISAHFGAGPRDTFVLGLARVFGRSIRVARTGLEITVLILGWLLGGTAGLGTVLFAVLIGPFMQLSVRTFGRFDPRKVQRAP
jgi:uncharacterized membrane protein YczE